MSLDRNGVEYKASDYRVLVRAPIDLRRYTVLQSCEEIIGSATPSESPFTLCNNTFTYIGFEEGSRLIKCAPHCFSCLAALRIVNMSNCRSFKTISEYMFSNCPLLDTVILPPLMTTFDWYCFEECKNLKYLKIPDSVTYLSYYMLRNVPIEKVDISPDSKINTIYTEAFKSSGLLTFFVPRDVTSLDGGIFMGCDNLTDITIHPDNHNFFKEGKSILSSDKTKLLVTREKGEFTVPSSVTKFAVGAVRGTRITKIIFNHNMESFDNWCCSGTDITEFTFPGGISNVAQSMLSYNHFLTTVYLTKEITTISLGAFTNSENLANINLLDSSLTGIKPEAFYGCCSLKLLEIPSTVTTIERSAFGNCTQLKLDLSRNNNFKLTANGLFFNKIDTVIAYFGESDDLEIPTECKTIEQYAFEGEKMKRITFGSQQQLTIRSYAFYETGLEEITFPSGSVTLESYCFFECFNLTTVNFNNCQIDYIPAYCFSDCHKLKSVNIPSTVTFIYEYAFNNCYQLASFDFQNLAISTIKQYAFCKCGIPNAIFNAALSSIGSGAFEGSSVATVDFSSTSITEIPNSCFSNCAELETLKFSSSTTTINTQAFSLCTKLQYFKLPQSINVIGSLAFFGCYSLTKFEISKDSNLETIKGRAFAECPKLLDIVLAPDENKLVLERGALLLKDHTKLIFFLPSSKTEIYVVPALVREIGGSAFEGCTNLKTIAIPSGVIESIGYMAFAGCTRLSCLYLPDKINSIGTRSFDGCFSLKCGSVLTGGSEELKKQLIDVGLNPIALETNCPKIQKSCKVMKPYPNLCYLLVSLVLYP